MERKIRLAKAITGSEVEVSTIIKELEKNSVHSLWKECEALDMLLQKHNYLVDNVWEDQLKYDFICSAAGCDIDEATMFIIYMEYLERSRNARQGSKYSGEKIL